MSNSMTDLTWEQAREKVRERWRGASCGAVRMQDKYGRETGEVRYIIGIQRPLDLSGLMASEPAAWLNAYARMTSSQPEKECGGLASQPVAAVELPPHWCKIIEPDNPDFSEKFACNDCGENFITMCSYARLKGQLLASQADVRKFEDTVAAQAAEMAALRSAKEKAEEKLVVEQARVNLLIAVRSVLTDACKAAEAESTRLREALVPCLDSLETWHGNLAKNCGGCVDCDENIPKAREALSAPVPKREA